MSHNEISGGDFDSAFQISADKVNIEVGRAGPPEPRRPAAGPRWAGAALALVLLAAGGYYTLSHQRGSDRHPDGAAGASARPSTPETSAPASAPAVSVPAGEKIDNSGGWGPRRPAFTMDHPASYPVFNSITDSPVGDEQNFVMCRDKRPGQEFVDDLVALDGHTYEVYLSYDNDIAANLDSMAEPTENAHRNLAARLQNARAHVQLPTEPLFNPGLTGFLTADNAAEVWDSCNFVAARRVSMRYVPGSARLFTTGTPADGTPLTGEDGLVTGAGAPIGPDQDGIVGQDAGYLLFDVTVTLS